MAAVDSTLKALLQPVVEALDCELWGLQLESGGKRKLLRIYIDREEGIGVEDCERVSRQSGAVLDVEDADKWGVYFRGFLSGHGQAAL